MGFIQSISKKLKIIIPTFAIIIVVVLIFLWINKKTESTNNQLRLQAEMQNKINEQKNQLDQQNIQIGELLKFKEEQQELNIKENEMDQKTEIAKKQISTSELANNQSANNNKTKSDSDIKKLKEQQKCQEKINKYNKCMNEYSAELAEYNECKAEHPDGPSLLCGVKAYNLCLKPDCD